MFRQRARVGCRRGLLWDRPVAPARRCFIRRRCHGYAPGSACDSPLRLSLLRRALLRRALLHLFSQLRLVSPPRLSLLPLLLQLRSVLPLRLKLLLLVLLLRRALLLLFLLLRSVLPL
jgi:hypothetical protein